MKYYSIHPKETTHIIDGFHWKFLQSRYRDFLKRNSLMVALDLLKPYIAEQYYGESSDGKKSADSLTEESPEEACEEEVEEDPEDDRTEVLT